MIFIIAWKIPTVPQAFGAYYFIKYTLEDNV